MKVGKVLIFYSFHLLHVFKTSVHLLLLAQPPLSPVPTRVGKIRLVGGLIGTPEEYYYVHYPGAEAYYYTESNIGYTGRLEIYHDGEWGTVCDEGVTDTEAEVICM